jgi:pyruvate dehydrogenase E1 component alpha subunit
MSGGVVQPIQLLDESGKLHEDPTWPLDVSAELCQRIYTRMVLARSFDEAAFALQRQGELGLWLQVAGQEAAQVASILALRPSDYVFPSYREHAAALARGIAPAELLSQWRGVENSGWDPKRYSFHIYTLVLGAQLLHATGYAMGAIRDGTEDVVVAYFGDGASSEGDANEAFNWAASAFVPLLFFCQNNQWAISTPTHIQMRTPLHERARGFGLEAHAVDGNDALAVFAVTSKVVDEIRAGGPPALIEALTYRMGGHSTSDDPTRYRTEAELDLWRSRDPLNRLETFMLREGLMDDELKRSVAAEGHLLGQRTREACLGLKPRGTDDLFDHVLAHSSSLLIEEKRHFKDLTARLT